MKVECPKCFGEGNYYSPLQDDIQKCNLCKGKKEVNEELADLYDPVSDMLNDLEIEDEN